MEPLDAIADTKERQSQTILITNLAPERQKKTVPLSLLRALCLGTQKWLEKGHCYLLSCHPLVKQCFKNPKPLFFFSLQTQKKKCRSEVLKILLLPSCSGKVRRYLHSVHLTRKFLLEYFDEIQKRLFQLQRFLAESLPHYTPKFWKSVFKQSCYFIITDYLLQQSQQAGLHPPVCELEDNVNNRDGFPLPCLLFSFLKS